MAHVKSFSNVPSNTQSSLGSVVPNNNVWIPLSYKGFDVLKRDQSWRIHFGLLQIEEEAKEAQERGEVVVKKVVVKKTGVMSAKAERRVANQAIPGVTRGKKPKPKTKTKKKTKRRKMMTSEDGENEDEEGEDEDEEEDEETMD